MESHEDQMREVEFQARKREEQRGYERLMGLKESCARIVERHIVGNNAPLLDNIAKEIRDLKL